MSDPLGTRVVKKSISLFFLPFEGRHNMSSNRKNGKFTKVEATEVREQASKTTSSSIQTAIAKAQQETIKTLSQVQEQAVTALGELETIKKAIEVERQEQERIHGVAAIALEIEDAQHQLEDRKADIDRQLSEYSVSFADKKNAMDREFREAEQAAQDRQKKSADQWAYEFENRKRDDQNAWEASKRRRDLDEQIRLEGFERSIKEREALMAAKEGEFVALKTKVEAFPAELDKAVKREVAIVTNSLTRDHNHSMEILTAKHAAEKTVSENTIDALKTDLANRDRIIEQLQAQLTSANSKVETIASKALESAANRQALADLQSINASQSSNGAKRA